MFLTSLCLRITAHTGLPVISDSTIRIYRDLDKVLPENAFVMYHSSIPTAEINWSLYFLLARKCPDRTSGVRASRRSINKCKAQCVLLW